MSRAIRAIVLTCDQYRAFTDHMIYQYHRLWPDNGFIYRIPYQDERPATSLADVEAIKTPAGIRQTVLALLEDLPDDEFVYWCIDDKYPIELDLDCVRQLAGCLDDLNQAKGSGLLFCRCRGLLHKNSLTGASLTDRFGRTYLERNGYHQIWIHQFLQVKVLRHLFRAFPGEDFVAKAMDTMKREIAKPACHRLYVTEQNHAVFGESTSRGIITRNCYESMIAHGCALPDWASEVTEEPIIMGDDDEDRPASVLGQVLSRLVRGRTTVSD